MTFLKMQAVAGIAVLAASAAAEQPLSMIRFASERVDSLIAKMTLEEKVGQLCQYNTKQHGFFFASSDATQASLPEEFLAKIRRGEVGGLISAPGLENYNVLQRAAMESRLKIPLIVGHDVIHGVEVYYPAPFPETCSWDSDLMRRTAERTAPRALRKGVNWTFAPMIDISRDSRWGRIVEGIGEDPFIGALAAAARVKGFQGERLSDGLHIAACAKHYVGYGAVQGGLDYDAVEMSDSTLRNVYLVPFRAAVDAGVATVMSGYHVYNGVHCSANRYLLTDVLRRDLGFGGFVISDYWSVGNLYDCGFARKGDDECAAATAVRSGIDMEMTGFCYPKGIGKALASGKLKMEEVDEAVRRVLATKERLGLFERPYLDRARLDAAIDDAADLELAREAAEKSVVLLKNRKGTLPLDKGRKVILMGDIADMPAEMGSSWINLAGSVKGIASLKEGLAAVGQVFEYERCYALTGAVDVAAVERAIARADVVVATFGAYRNESGENRSRADISLSAGQREVIRAIEKSGKTFVAVVFNGRPMVLSELASAADALVEGWQLGSCAGWGVARVLTGEAEPYGRLTATFPNASGECPAYYGRVIGGKSWIPGGDRRKENMWRGHYRDTKMEPVFPFGFGLAYTDFAYSNETARICGDALVCSADVVNTGARRGTEVVQVYIRREISPIAAPRRELKGFQRVWLEPGERKTVEIRIPLRSLDYYVEGPKPHAVQGPLSVFIAPDASRGRRLRVDGEIRVRDPFIVTDGGRYLLVSSTAEGVGPDTDSFGERRSEVVVYESTDLVRWSSPMPVLTLPKDFDSVALWSPELHAYRGDWYLFVTVNYREKKAGRGERGTWIFKSKSPKGPFAPHSKGSITPESWSALDGTLHVEDGHPYMVFCHEWIQVNPGTICAVRMTDDLTAAAGEPFLLFDASRGGEGCRITDGPWLFKDSAGALQMLWSSLIPSCGGCYGVLQTTSHGGRLAGPWSDTKVVATDGGHAMVFTDLQKGQRLTFHGPNRVPDERLKTLPCRITERGIGL